MIDSSEAVAIAREKVTSARGEGVLDDRLESVADEDGNWHVSFPWADPGMFGGEPHVIVGPDGTVISFYSTQ